jgi:hypothetical protein
MLDLIDSDTTLNAVNLNTFLLELNKDSFTHLFLQEYYKDRKELKQDLELDKIDTNYNKNLQLHAFIYDILNMFPDTVLKEYKKEEIMFTNDDIVDTVLYKFLKKDTDYIGNFKSESSTTSELVKNDNYEINNYTLSKDNELILTKDDGKYRLKPLKISTYIDIYYDLPMYSALTKYHNNSKPDTYNELIEVLDLLTKDLPIPRSVSARGIGRLSRGRGRDSLRRQSVDFKDTATYAEIDEASMGFGGNVGRGRGYPRTMGQVVIRKGSDSTNEYDAWGNGRVRGSVRGRGSGSGSGRESIVYGDGTYDNKDYTTQGTHPSGSGSGSSIKRHQVRGNQAMSNITYSTSGQESSTEDP